MLQKLGNRIIIVGHYGSGKTNLSVNLALDLKRAGREVVLADLDIVNPYFRTADFRALAAKEGVGVIAPNYAGSNLDIPSLTGELDACLGQDKTVIIDVGGDDAGAYALGRYAPRLKENPYDMLYVVNKYRYLTKEPEEAAALLREIEDASRLRATALVNNSNLSYLTTLDEVEESVEYARKVGRILSLPLWGTAVKEELCREMAPEAIAGKYPVKIFVTLPWQ